MNKEIELTKRLKELEVCMPEESIDTIWSDFHKCKLPWDGNRGLSADGGMVLWTIPSCLTWLREKEWEYDMGSRGTLAIPRIEISVDNIGTGRYFSSSVSPGQELQGLLECMIKIMEGEK